MNSPMRFSSADIMTHAVSSLTANSFKSRPIVPNRRNRKGSQQILVLDFIFFTLNSLSVFQPERPGIFHKAETWQGPAGTWQAGQEAGKG